jgi:hypothetical protein
MSRQILETHPRYILFSLDAIDQLYERMRGFPYAKVRDNIFRLLKLKDIISPETGTQVVATVSDENANAIFQLCSQWFGVVTQVSVQPRVTWETKHEPKKSCQESTVPHFVVLTNGDVVPCCIDWKGEVVLGNAFTQPLREMVKPAGLLNSNLCTHCTEYMWQPIPQFARFGR